MASRIAATFALLLALAAIAGAKLVPSTPLILEYHNGPVLSGDGPIKVYLIFYGRFSKSDRATITDFLNSFDATPTPNSVAAWWSLTHKYVDSQGQGVAQSLSLAATVSDTSYSLGKILQRGDIAKLIASKAFPVDPRAIYLVLTASDVTVDRFCMNTCGEHLYTFPSSAGAGASMVPYAWVGNSATQCPGFCQWPYAKPQFGPQDVLKAPNNAAIDGMIITIAKVLAGAATNPFGTAYYQGDQTMATEAAGACVANYGPGAYPGYPGELLVDSKSGASYNVVGAHGRKFLVPWLWNPSTFACAGHP